MTPVSFAGTGESGVLSLPEMGTYRVDVDVPSGLTIAYNIKTRGKGSSQFKVAKLPNDVTTDWDLTASEAFIIDGPIDVVIDVQSRSGNSNSVVITAVQVE